MPAERLHKVLARSGLGSRRACEAWIVQGRVRVNGHPARLGQSVTEGVDEIRVDGRPLPTTPTPIVVAIHKPAGVVSSLRPQGPRRTVRDLVPLPGRLYPAGRLDLESEGLMILTNDGDLALRLTHPRYGHEKEYRVLLDRPPQESELRAWRRKESPDVRPHPSARIEREASSAQGRWVRVTLQEGKKRQIRESARSVGLSVRRLIRVRMGGLRLGRMEPGSWRVLTPAEVRGLISQKAGRGAGLKEGS